MSWAGWIVCLWLVFSIAAVNYAIDNPSRLPQTRETRILVAKIGTFINLVLIVLVIVTSVVH